MQQPPEAFPLSSWFTGLLVSSGVGESQLIWGPAFWSASASPGKLKAGGLRTIQLRKTASQSGPNLRIPVNVMPSAAFTGEQLGGGLEECNVRSHLSAVRESVDHNWLSTTSRTCDYSSLLTARAASRFSSRFCSVFTSSLACDSPQWSSESLWSQSFSTVQVNFADRAPN